MRRQRPRLAPALLLVLTLTACSSVDPTAGPAGTHATQRASISVPPRPQDSVCEAIVRHEIAIAIAVRAQMGGVIAATRDAAMSAADDEGADVTSYGIPLTAAELKALRAAGVPPDPQSVMTAWVAAHENVFGSPHLVGRALIVAVRNVDPTVLEQTRCFEVGHLRDEVTYESAPVMTRAALDALLARVVSDREMLMREDIEFTTAWTDEVRGVVVIGVRNLSPAVASALVARYGPFVQPVEHEGFSPAD